MPFDAYVLECAERLKSDMITLVPKKGAAYNLPETDLGLSRDEIVSFIRETRER